MPQVRPGVPEYVAGPTKGQRTTPLAHCPNGAHGSSLVFPDDGSPDPAAAVSDSLGAVLPADAEAGGSARPLCGCALSCFPYRGDCRPRVMIRPGHDSGGHQSHQHGDGSDHPVTRECAGLTVPPRAAPPRCYWDLTPAPPPEGLDLPGLLWHLGLADSSSPRVCRCPPRVGAPFRHRRPHRKRRR